MYIKYICILNTYVYTPTILYPEMDPITFSKENLADLLTFLLDLAEQSRRISFSRSLWLTLAWKHEKYQ